MSEPVWWCPECKFIQSNKATKVHLDTRDPLWKRCHTNLIDLVAERERMRNGLNDVLNAGHDDDCVFCGFKDKRAMQALDAEAPAPVAAGDCFKCGADMHGLRSCACEA